MRDAMNYLVRSHTDHAELVTSISRQCCFIVEWDAARRHLAERWSGNSSSLLAGVTKLDREHARHSNIDARCQWIEVRSCWCCPPTRKLQRLR